MGYFFDQDDPKDPLGILAKPKKNGNADPLGILDPVKKKETGFKIPGTPSLDLSLPLDSGGLSIEEEDDPVKTVAKPLAEASTKAYNDYRSYGNQGRNISESLNQANYGSREMINKAADFQHQLKKDFETTTDLLHTKTNEVVQKVLPNGKVAIDYLKDKVEKNKGKLPEDNTTINIAIDKANRFLYLKEKVDSGKPIDQIALETFKESNPEVNKKFTVIEGGGLEIPEVMRGKITKQFLDDPDVQEIYKDNPEYERLKNGGIYAEFPALAENEVRNRMSRAYEKRRANIIINPVFNKSKFLDNLSDEEFANEPELKKVADSFKGHWEDKIHTTAVLDNIAHGAGSTFSGMGKSIKDLFGFGDTEAERLQKGLEQQYGAVTDEAKGAKKIIGQASDFAGMLAAMGAVGTPARLLKMNPTVANAAITGATFYDQELNNWTNKFPGEPHKAKIGAGLSTALFMAAHKIFPSSQVTDKMIGKLQPEILDALNKSEGSIVSAELQKNLATKLVEGAKQAGANIISGANTMAKITMVQDMIGQAMGAKPIADEDYIDVVKSMVIGLTFPEMMKAHANRNVVGETLNSIATFPDRYKGVLENMKITNPEMEAEINRKLQDIDFLSNTKAQLNEKGIAEKNQQRYLVEAMGEKYSAEKVKKETEPTIDKQEKEKIKEHQEIKDRILQGEDHENIVTEAEQKKIDEQEEARVGIENIQKKKELDNEKFDAQRKGLDGRNPEDKLKIKEIELNREIKNKEHDKKIAEQEKKLNQGETPERSVATEETTELPKAEEQKPSTVSGSEKIVEPTQKEIANDIKEGRFTTVEFNSESEVPEMWRDKISSKGETNGKKIIRVTLPTSQYEYESKTGTSKKITEYPTEKTSNISSTNETKEQGGVRQLGETTQQPPQEQKPSTVSGRRDETDFSHPKWDGKELWQRPYMGESGSERVMTPAVGEKGDLGANVNVSSLQKNMIEDAIAEGRYEKEIKEGRMTASDAKIIIESVGAEVPQDILIDAGVEKSKSQPSTEAKEIKNEQPINEAVSEPTQPEQAKEEPQPKETAAEFEQPTEESQPPNEPPKELVVEEGEPLKNKALATRLVEAKNIPENAREGIKSSGLKYEPKSQQEAGDVAKSVIDEIGMDEAVLQAQAGKFGGDVNTLIQTESLNRLSELSEKEKDPATKLEYDKKFAEIAIQLDEFLRDKAGRGIVALNFFYKKSPLGVQMVENAKRKQDFDNWSKPKDKSWKDFFDEMMKEPEFEKVVKEQVKEEIKKERAEARKSRKEKIDKFFDDAKKGFEDKGATYATIIPPKVITAAIEGMRKAYHAGEKVVELIEEAVAYISDKLGHDNWDKEKFRKEWGEKLKEKIEKKSLTDEEIKLKILDKFRKKLKGLTEKQKDEVIRQSHKKLIENDALEYEDFKKIIARVIGRGELTPEEAAKMKELVKKTNELEDAAKAARDTRTPEALNKFKTAELETAKASKQLNELFYNRPDIIKRLTSIMQLNTLGIPSLINNPIYNIWNQALLRFPVGVINDVIDRGISGVAKAMGKNYQREYNVFETQKEFWRMLGVGAKEVGTQLATGLNRADYTQKEVYTEQIRPFTAIRDLIAYKQGKKNLTKAQVMDKAIQATAGIPAEIVARFLNIGDKPQRFAAEGAQASAFAKALGLKEMDYKLFVEFPREEAYRAYKGQGLNDEVAGQKADYVKEAIIKEGQRSTFQQDNLLNNAISAAAGMVFGGKDTGLAALAKSLTISPYIKIPSNAFWSMYNLLNPEIAMLQSMVHGGKSKVLSNKGETTKSKLQLREARYWMAHAIVGIGMRGAVMALVKQGIFTPASDEDDTKKKRDATNYFDRAGTVEIGGMKISNRWFGQIGMLGNQIAKKYYDATPEQRENQDEFWNMVFGGMEVEGLKELQNGVFANSSSILQSLGSGDASRYFMNTINLFINIVQPAAIAQINRAALDEVPTSKGDGFLDKLNQNFAQRSALYRKVFDVKIDKKRDIWGQTIPKGGNILSRMFGVSKANPQIFARPLYDDYLRTSDTGFLPPAVMPILNGQKLNKQQYDRLQEYVGAERKKRIEPYINDMAVIPGYDEFYSKLDDKIKKERLTYIYDLGRDAGIEKFYSDFPQFRPKEKTDDQIENQETKEESNKQLKDFFEQ